MSLGWILFQREALSAKVQRELHHDHAPLPAEGVRSTPHRLQLSPLQGRATAGHSGEASLRPRSGLLPFLLEVGHLGVHPFQQKAATSKNFHLMIIKWRVLPFVRAGNPMAQLHDTSSE